MPFLQQVAKDTEQDTMCRHEAAEALGALGYEDSLEILKALRDDQNESDVIRETCDIAVDRILWENSEARKAEKLKTRYEASVLIHPVSFSMQMAYCIVCTNSQ